MHNAPLLVVDGLLSQFRLQDFQAPLHLLLLLLHLLLFLRLKLPDLCKQGLNFVSIPQREPWGSPHARWKGHVSNRFPTPAHAVIHKSTVLSAILAGTPEQPFPYTCTCCHTYKCSVICHSGRYTLTNSSPHLHMLSYKCSVIVLSTIPAGTPEQPFPHTCACCHTQMQCYPPFRQVHLDQLFPSPAHAVIHTSVVLSAIQAGTLDQLFPTPVYAVVHPSAVLPDTPADTHDQLFPHTCPCCCTSKCSVTRHSSRYTWSAVPHTCVCCCTSKCSVTRHSSRYTWSAVPPHLSMLLYIQVLQQVHLINSFPTPVHAVVHTSVLLPANPTAVLQLQGFS